MTVKKRRRSRIRLALRAVDNTVESLIKSGTLKPDLATNIKINIGKLGVQASSPSAPPKVAARSSANAYSQPPHGLPYFVNDSGNFPGLWRSDVNCPEDRVYFLNTRHFQT